MKNDELHSKMKDSTRLAHAARGGIMAKSGLGTINAPVYRASTLTFPTLDSLKTIQETLKAEGRTGYGRLGSDTVWDFEQMLADLDHADGAICTESGLAAVTLTLTAFVSAGDHILVSDSVYGPARAYCDGVLSRFGVEVTYFDPLISIDALEGMIKANSKLLFLETPGSITFGVQDIEALAALARKHGLFSAIDNTWATPLLFKPMDFGCDVSVQAGTKYIVGHSDALFGVVTANGKALEALRAQNYWTGHHAAPDVVALATRGLRTMDVRLERHHKSGLEVAAWLENRPEVAAVLHPGLPSHPQHALAQRQFKGYSGLFSFIFKPNINRDQVALFVEALQFYSMGYSWGGFESLVVPQYPQSVRTASSWPPSKELSGQVMRLHIGLEAVEDLIADLEQALNKMKDPERNQQTKSVLGGLFGRRS